MPRRAKSPCNYPGCPELTDERYCPAHKKETNAHYNKYKRDPRTKAWYDSRWRKIQKAYISKHPLCAVCLLDGRYTPAEIVHHKIELSEGGTHDEDNLQSLCLPHHSAEHMKRRHQ